MKPLISSAFNLICLETLKLQKIFAQLNYTSQVWAVPIFYNTSKRKAENKYNKTIINKCKQRKILPKNCKLLGEFSHVYLMLCDRRNQRGLYQLKFKCKFCYNWYIYNNR